MVVRRTGRRTPLTVVEAALELPDKVPAEIAEETLVMVLPAELVVVTETASDTEMADDAVTEDSTVLPSEFVVVIATTVGVMEVA